MTEQEQLLDHEQRLRKLEESDIKQQVKLQEIQTSQIEIKNMLLEQKQDSSKAMEKYMEKITNSLTDTIKNNNNRKTFSNKQMWAIIGTLITGLGTGLGLILKFALR